MSPIPQGSGFGGLEWEYNSMDRANRIITWVINIGGVALLLAVGGLLYQVNAHETRIGKLETAGSPTALSHIQEDASRDAANAARISDLRADVESLKEMKADIAAIKAMLSMHLQQSTGK